MGEARRRRDYDRAHAAEIAADLERRRAEFAYIEEIASEDPGDREDRLAHGFTLDDDWRDPELLCRNGCGLPYAEVVAGKIRMCRGEMGAADPEDWPRREAELRATVPGWPRG